MAGWRPDRARATREEAPGPPFAPLPYGVFPTASSGLRRACLEAVGASGRLKICGVSPAELGHTRLGEYLAPAAETRVSVIGEHGFHKVLDSSGRGDGWTLPAVSRHSVDLERDRGERAATQASEANEAQFLPRETDQLQGKTPARGVPP